MAGEGFEPPTFGFEIRCAIRYAIPLPDECTRLTHSGRGNRTPDLRIKNPLRYQLRYPAATLSEGLEPPRFGFAIRCSVQLSYKSLNCRTYVHAWS